MTRRPDTDRPTWAGPGWAYRVVTVWQPTGEVRLVWGPDTPDNDGVFQMLIGFVDGLNRDSGVHGLNMDAGPPFTLQRAPTQDWETVWPTPEPVELDPAAARGES